MIYSVSLREVWDHLIVHTPKPLIHRLRRSCLARRDGVYVPPHSMQLRLGLTIDGSLSSVLRTLPLHDFQEQLLDLVKGSSEPVPVRR